MEVPIPKDVLTSNGGSVIEELAYLVSGSTGAILTGDLFLSSVFFTDMIFQFNTMFYYPSGRLENHRSKIARRYLGSLFLLDFVTSLPLAQIFSMHKQTTFTTSISNFFRLLRIWRLQATAKRVRESEAYLQMRAKISIRVWKLLVNLMLFLLIAHWCGCLWAGLASFSVGDKSENWADRYDSGRGGLPFDATAGAGLYIVSIYW